LVAEPKILLLDEPMAGMNLEEKAGLMFINMILMNKDGSLAETPSVTNPMSFALESNSKMVANKKMNHFNTLQSPSAEAMANWNNNIQKLAERTRLGIPITIATDPRHSAIENPGASIPTPFFSNWCSPLGFAAIGDSTLMREFGDIARQEYTALGMRLSLSPMADLATEPRWCRVNGTFGEDAELAAKMVKAYILGFQGDSLNTTSVACMTKHFSGGGPQKDGEDAHFPYGAEQVYPGDNFDYHLIPFEKGAFEANTAQIMPYYGIPIGQTEEDVAFAFNKTIINEKKMLPTSLF
jgi:beta-glucosidase